MTDEIKMNEFGKNLPEKKFVAGAISATVWRNEVKNSDAEFQTITIQRAYKDKNGNWKNTSSLRTNDIPKTILVLQKAYEYIFLKEDLNDE
jgi:hypothetical protein